VATFYNTQTRKHDGFYMQEQLDAAIAKARRDALEEAEKMLRDDWGLISRHECADAIRALADKQEET
jgi:hypothetical protein